MYIQVVPFCLVFWCWFFFFFKQKTAYEMRISDWSSDVCSSDLTIGLHLATRNAVEIPMEVAKHRNGHIPAMRVPSNTRIAFTGSVPHEHRLQGQRAVAGTAARTGRTRPARRAGRPRPTRYSAQPRHPTSRGTPPPAAHPPPPP